MQRFDNTRLPDGNELSRILDTEAERAVPLANEAVHFVDFTPVIRLLDHLSLSSDLFTNDHLDIHEVLRVGALVLDDLIQGIPKNLNDPHLVDLLRETYGYLSEEDPLEQSDVLFIFGSKTQLRVEKGLALHEKDIGRLIVVSGGNPFYAGVTETTEARNYQDYLVLNGVPASKIVVEDESITIPDNVRRSLNLLDDLGQTFNSITLVNSPYSQRRGWATFKKYLSSSVRVLRVNSKTAPEYQIDHWYEQEATLRIVLNEYVKMRAAVVNNNA
jgi:uncharacterized SAM-binding protein YcdF (DUF218 family)